MSKNSLKWLKRKFVSNFYVHPHPTPPPKEKFWQFPIFQRGQHPGLKLPKTAACCFRRKPFQGLQIKASYGTSLTELGIEGMCKSYIACYLECE
jgi:hypothetical protein